MTYIATFSKEACTYSKDGKSITREEFEAALLAMARAPSVEPPARPKTAEMAEDKP